MLTDLLKVNKKLFTVNKRYFVNKITSERQAMRNQQIVLGLKQNAELASHPLFLGNWWHKDFPPNHYKTLLILPSAHLRRLWEIIFCSQ